MKHQYSKTILLITGLFIGFSGFGQVIFSDVSSTAGINAVGSNHGLSVGDYDNDGDDDLFFPRNNNFDNILYRNNGDGTFTDVTATAGLGYAGSSNNAVWGDLNKDGWLDLYVGNVFEPNLLYYNNGDGTFTEGGQTAGVDHDGKTKSLILIDINNDSWLDIYVANANEQNAFYLNNTDGSFSDIVFPSNTKDELNAMAAIFFDFDNDNDQDLYLTHDGNEANILYENNGSGYFTDVSVSSGTNIAAQGMGVDAGDINKDGFLDLYITNLYDNALLLNNGDGTFTNIAVSAGVNDYGMGWGTNFLDFDNDGQVDIYVSNDTYFSPYPNVLYKNNGDNTFTIVGENDIVSSTGGGYATACTDINDDGMIDLLIANAGMIEGNQLLRNLSPTNGNWLKVNAIGTLSNESAIGARITVEANGEIFIDQVMAGNGYATQNSLTQHFGLGNATMIDRVSVQFPSGIVNELENVSPNQTITITEDGNATSLHESLLNAFRVRLIENPVRQEIRLALDLPATLDLHIQLLDTKGQLIRNLFEGKPGLETTELSWSATTLGLQAAQHYILQIITEQGHSEAIPLLFLGP